MFPVDRGIPTSSAVKLARDEQEHFRRRTPKSRALAEATKQHWLAGVPMPWMVDWGTPYPLVIAEAGGATLRDADGNDYADFCLGDTGAMFGHSPAPVVAALRRQAARGLTTMLPSEDTVEVGALLARRFGFPVWQVTATATDANRSIIRLARAISGRSRLLVFNGCYHGAVDDTFVEIENGCPRNRRGLVGEVQDFTRTTTVIEFNDLEALERALQREDVALVLAEPVMTNCGVVLPQPGYHETLRALTRKHGTLLAIDETHTISTGPAGYTGAFKLEPDIFVLGKPISGGIPAAVFGLSADVAARVTAHHSEREPGYSGIGTTLSGNALQLAGMRAVLEEILTEPVYARAMPKAEALEAGIAEIIARHGLPWHVVRIGLRVEFVCAAERPRNGTEAGRVAHNAIERALHLFCLNRGVVITPFHNMMLICPATTGADVVRLLGALDTGIAALEGAS